MKSPAANGGWVKVYRRLWENPIFRNKQEAGVWVWMCACAAHEAVTIRTKYGPVHLKRGEILVAERTIAEDFGLSRRAVRSLLTRMTEGGPQGVPMLALKRDRTGDRTGTVALVVKYHEYQCVSTQHQLPLDHDRTAQRTADRTASGPQTDQEQGKEEEKKSVTPPYSPPPPQNERDFERFWKAYPSRDGAPNPKKPAREKFRLKVRDGALPEDIVHGAESFAASVALRREKEGGRFDAAGAVCQAVTFLNQERYDDYKSDADAPLTDEQRAILKQHNGAKRPWHAPNVVELKLGPGPPESGLATEEQGAEAG